MTLRELQERNDKKWIAYNKDGDLLFMTDEGKRKMESKNDITEILPIGTTEREFKITKANLFIQAAKRFCWCNVDKELKAATATLSEEKQERSFTVKTGENWTASSLLIDYAKRNKIPVNYGKYGQIRLMIDGKLYGYKCVDNIYNNPLTVFLQEV